MSGAEGALACIKASVNRLIETGRKGGVTAQAHSFMYSKTGERNCRNVASDNLPQNGLFDNLWKQFALTMRDARCVLVTCIMKRKLRKPKTFETKNRN